MRRLGLCALACFVTVLCPLLSGPAAAETVRAETAERLGRMIFSWPQPVGFRLMSSNDRAIVSFAQPSVAQIDAAAQKLGDYIVKVRRSGDGQVVIFDLASGVKVDSRAQGNDVVLEFSAAKAAQKPDDAKSKADRVVFDVQSSGIGTRLTFDWPFAVGYTTAPDRQGGLIVVFDKTGTLDLAAHADALKKAGLSVTQVPATGKLVVKLGVPPEMLVRDRREGNRISFDVVPANAVTTTKPNDDKRGDAKLEHTEGVTVAVASDAGGLTLTFGWPVRLPAAAFRRGEQIWVVFPRGANIDLAELRARLGKGVSDVDRVPAGDTLALRFTAAPDVGLQLRRDGLDWTLSFLPRRIAPRTTASLRSEPAPPPGGRVVVRSGSGGPVLRLVDPELGGVLLVVPNHAAGVGLDTVREFAKFRLLPSLQGIVVEPKADGLTVSAASDGVEITHGQGLALSEAPQ